jgi:hypothetical protein
LFFEGFAESWRSSVVEHSLGKGEVESSSLSVSSRNWLYELKALASAMLAEQEKGFSPWSKRE